MQYACSEFLSNTLSVIHRKFTCAYGHNTNGGKLSKPITLPLRASKNCQFCFLKYIYSSVVQPEFRYNSSLKVCKGEIESRMTILMVKKSWRPYIVLAFGLLAVSSSAILIRFAQDNGAPSLVISAWRVGVAWLVLTPFILSGSGYRAELTKLDRKTLALAALSGAFLAAHFSSWITSLEYTSVISSVVLVTTNPICSLQLTQSGWCWLRRFSCTNT